MQFDGPITRIGCFDVACISMKEKVIQHGPIYTMHYLGHVKIVTFWSVTITWACSREQTLRAHVVWFIGPYIGLHLNFGQTKTHFDIAQDKFRVARENIILRCCINNFLIYWTTRLIMPSKSMKIIPHVMVNLNLVNIWVSISNAVAHYLVKPHHLHLIPSTQLQDVHMKPARLAISHGL